MSVETDTSFVLFPHLLSKKRKREDSLGGDGLNSSLAEYQLRCKRARIEHNSPMGKVKRRLLSDTNDHSNALNSLKQLESTCISGTLHMENHFNFDLSNIHSHNKTPKKIIKKDSE